MTTLKDILQNDQWIIYNISQGYNNEAGKVRIDALRRFTKPGRPGKFSKWFYFKYANDLFQEYQGKQITEHKNYSDYP